VRDPGHLEQLRVAVSELGEFELLVNNASALGPSPLPRLTAYPPEQLLAVLETNVVAPLALIQTMTSLLRQAASPRILNITSDAAVEAYAGWGGYGASKAALEQLGQVMAVEEPSWRVWTVDPGDLRTDMHQAAFPGEDISDRPEPETVVPALLSLIGSDRPSGRYRVAELAQPYQPVEVRA
jgi:NAD(P)-dependent dehydrogenase (short-subunit alcohol dehydrogenase family)